MRSTEILQAVVTATVPNTPGVRPRPGQALMEADASSAMSTRTHAAMIGPTGVGKSFAMLAAAAARAINLDERTVFATESLNLQAQILTKDGPAICRAVVSLGGRPLAIAILKGVSNYLDPRQLLAVAHQLVGSDKERGLRILADQVDNAVITSDAVADLELFGATIRSLRPLISWGLRQYLLPAAVGDRDSCPLPHSDDDWAWVSSPSDDAADEDYVIFPKAKAARAFAAQADILVTNHTLIAIQAVTGLPIVISNKTLGTFHHIIVDEAHGLPAKVRELGRTDFSAAAVLGLRGAVRRTRTDKVVDDWLAEGSEVARAIEAQLAQLVEKEAEVTLNESVALFPKVTAIVRWAETGADLVKGLIESPNPKISTLAVRASRQAANFAAHILAVATGSSAQVRWATRPATVSTPQNLTWTTVSASPVDVSSLISQNLWVRTSESGASVPLSVIALSATLPQNFSAVAGLRASIAVYESPFDAAYANSALFIPHASNADYLAVTSVHPKSSSKVRKFDTLKHAIWCQAQMVALVRANAGSALVLAATSAAGQAYVSALRRELPEITVYSQWEGEMTARLVARWKADEASVLVGTKSLMTGVDAPGRTCSLVILDRMPRAPGNPVDEARAKLLGGNMWASRNTVYGGDAAIFAEQAAGRLIRSEKDVGMVAVLEPRLLKVGGEVGPLTYPEDLRDIYMQPLRKFGTKIRDRAAAVAWLKDRRPQSA